MIFTIGHSNHSLQGFLDLLTLHGITALADVRSHPVSRYTPHFSRTILETSLRQKSLTYVYLGNILGGRSDNPECYVNSRVNYTRLASEPEFVVGMERLKKGAQKFRLALMCSEKDPVVCHRALLLGRLLHLDGLAVQHIHCDGLLETQTALELRLLTLCGMSEDDMFRSRQECINDAYELQVNRVAYSDEALLKEQDHV